VKYIWSNSYLNFKHRENMKIRALSSKFWQQITDLKQLFGLKKQKW